MPIKTEKKTHSPFYFTKEETFEEKPWVNKKAQRAEDLYNQTVEEGGFVYDAGERSMDRIDRVLTLANAKMNAALAQGMTHADAFKAVYVDTPVPWVMADNTIQLINANALMQVQDKAMEGMKSLGLKYG